MGCVVSEVCRHVSGSGECEHSPVCMFRGKFALVKMGAMGGGER